MSRKRHIKCDEAKPVCGQCAKSKRHCRGPLTLEYRFAAPQTSVTFGPKAQNPRPRSQISLANGNAEENRAFDYYLSNLGPMLAGECSKDVDFWTNLVPRWCLSDTVLWTALVSLSDLHRTRPTGADGFAHFRNLSNYQWSLENHGRAIKEYRHRLSTKTIDIPRAFLGCILFALFEFQMWNNESALMLVRTSVKLSQQVQTWPDDMDIKEGVSRFFAKLASLVSPTNALPDHMLTNVREDSALRPSLIVSMPPSMEKLRKTLYTLVDAASRVLQDTSSECSLNTQEIKDLRSRQRQILEDLDDWQRTRLAVQRSNASDFLDYLSSLLLVYCKVTYIKLSVCMSGKETRFDRHTDDFREIIHHGAATIHYALSATIKPPSSFELNVVPAFSFVSQKCRHPGIRRRARDLMTKSRGMTCTCNPWLIDLADAAIQIEEDSIRPQNGDNEDDHGQGLDIEIPEQGRIKRWHVSKVQSPSWETILVASFILNPCEREDSSVQCVREVTVQLESHETLNDVTIHMECCPSMKVPCSTVTPWNPIGC
ncbi:hypothetical protein H2204_000591 [Knufia peltigerae]|uniref:Zn(2)-C6 fungal-type domain-containing protein n=1 Tax=Knufia peltigerae TaxID=1002370 RepID=A0AA38YFA3_9EURO|nr:hypothetical protein H2204_000591 [Knufia peltigerae]